MGGFQQRRRCGLLCSVKAGHKLLSGDKNMSRKLHIGGQLKLPDWEVLNIQPGPCVDHIGDAKDLSQFGDETFDELYASHVVEHFDYNGPLQKAFKEWYRVLKPEGKLYISVPDMDVLCQLFRKRKELDLQSRFQIMRMMFGGHIDPYDYHYVGLDFEILTAFLSEAKFRNPKQVEELGVFKDTSLLRVAGIPISLNVIAVK
jgi:predicted SAM-dependent methyltransferase